MTAPLSINALWRETFATGRAGMGLYLPVAAAFVLLPNVLTEAFGPALPKTAADLTGPVVLVHLALPSLVGLIAQMTIVRLAVASRTGVSRSVGEALGLSLRWWPVLVIATLLAAVPTAAGLLLLILPGLYMAGRLAMVLPLVVEEGAGGVDAVRRSWALTEGNGLRIIGFALMWVGWFLALSVLAAGVGSGIGSVLTLAGAGTVGAFVVSLLGALVAAVYTVFSAVGVATIYLHLRGKV